MRSICKKEYTPYPKIEYTGTHFYIVFRQSEEYLKMTEAGKTRGKTMEKIIDVMRINPYISIQELASKMRLSEKGVEWQIKSLKKNGVLKRIGPDKGGVWKLLEK